MVSYSQQYSVMLHMLLCVSP